MFRAATSPPSLTTLVLLTAFSVLSLNMFLPSLENIAKDFQVDYAMANLSIAGYLAITAVLQIIMGPLSDRFGRRPVMLAGLGIFSFASIGCLLATDIWVFLAFRLLQGALIAGMTLSRAAVRDQHSPQKAASLLGYISMAMAVAPMTGPLFGGILDQLFGWRATFVFFVAAGFLLWWLAWADMGETNETPSATIRAQFKTYPELLRSRRFWGYAFCLTFSLGAFYVYITGAALVGGAVFGLSPAAIGAGVGIITCGFAVGSFLSGRFANRFPLTTMVISGRVVAACGPTLGLLLMAAGVLHPITYFGAITLVGMGNGLTIPSANSGIMSVRPQLSGSAAGLSGAMAVAGGAALTSLTGAVLTPETGALTLMLLVLASVLLSLLAALYVRWVDMRDPLPE
ncbi:Bcr/CflA subfamily drug resistance transporter [Shimia isoporae]|uniref:Bcr/CflA family efflux transporter n=1 Tax=Shimia isoporae TaxID=647720 RepID=A0A4R1NPQ4_9RHOB|nr:multidrug effflux MFS transporter [Shimia isoporae]TCL10215.1 Bcr/CflA subfamily drug resistance transporter [Shimia isoporae]